MYDPVLDVGWLVVVFDCQAREDKVKKHTLRQLRGTSSYKQEDGVVVMVKIVEPEPVAVEPEPLR